jgi:hypothetical protein
MSTDQAIVQEIAPEIAPAESEAQSPGSAAALRFAETALTVMFAAAAVLFVSFVAVVTGLV